MDEVLVFDYSEQLHDLLFQSEQINENLIVLNNDLVNILEIFLIIFGVFIGIVIVSNVLQVIFK